MPDEKLTPADVRMIRALTMHLPVSRGGLPLESLEEMMRRIAREEIASLAGLALRRSDEPGSSFWGEALSDFSGHTKGEEPGE